MNTYLAAFLVSALVSVLVTRGVRDLALARGLVDAPDGHRKVHDQPIPRLGGIGIALGFVVPLLALSLVDNPVADAVYQSPVRLAGLLAGAGLMVGLGVADDLVGLSARPKFTVQTVAALVAWGSGFTVERVANPFGAPIELGILALPITLLWIVGVTNALNLIDGLDGLAGGVSFVACVLLFVIGAGDGRVLLAVLAASLAGALLGFLRYNFNPASIFMGDCGSLFLGFVLAVTGIWSSSKSSTVVALAIPVVALGVPIADTGMAMVRRFIRGKPMFSADREHLHHRLLDLGLSKRQAVVVIYVACAVLGAAALGMVHANGPQSAVILGTVFVAALASGRAIGWLDPETLRVAWRFGRMRQVTTLERIVAAREAVVRLRAAASVEDALAVLVEAAPALHVQSLDVHLEVDGTSYRRSWASGSAETLRTYPVDWELGTVRCRGHVGWGWEAPEHVLQLPEEPCLDLLTLALRDRVLEVCRDRRAAGRAAG